MVELPQGVFNLYKTNLVRQANVLVTDIDDADSAEGKLSKERHIYYHAWLILGGPEGRRPEPLKVY